MLFKARSQAEFESDSSKEAALTSTEGSHARSVRSLSCLTLTPKCIYVRVLGGHAAIHVLAFIP